MSAPARDDAQAHGTLDLPLVPPPGGTVLHSSERATVIWGDCRDPAVIAAVPDWYGLLCTDPPYGKAWHNGYHRRVPFEPLAGDDGSVDWPAVLAEWVGPTGTYNQGLASSRHVYVFGYRPEALAEPLRLGRAAAELIWDKCKTGLGSLEQPWGPAHEVLTFGVHTKSRAGRAKGEGTVAARMRKGSVLRVPRKNSTQVNRHPTEKPVALMQELIESSTVRGDLVVDPCAGSGSTGVAAVLAGRRAHLVEIDRRYAELAADRVRAAEAVAAQMDRL
ncbi:DNA-methyltransferase [Streptomyces aidingensis]|uniref:Methyltransferase n=1 Tax=Streptomyces aidingensis TaxID=910347 RepID=A0A1I1PTS7_9ACTN|nr:DNA methyltransferase [Streptomyces aidingensis]SFD13067.1 site-specific DNA-methyltransferase (adenine-specific) [Streptomyces aidingensis]